MLIYYIVYHAIGKNINSIPDGIVALFADTGNTASGYRKPDSIENEVRQDIIYIRFLPTQFLLPGCRYYS